MAVVLPKQALGNGLEFVAYSQVKLIEWAQEQR
jgi:hypothetical protein